MKKIADIDHMLLIHADGTTEVVDWTDDLTLLQKHVQGYIEFPPMPPGVPHDLICNEEGRLRGMGVNNLASSLYRTLWATRVHPGQLVPDMMVLVGPVIIRFNKEA